MKLALLTLGCFCVLAAYSLGRERGIYSPSVLVWKTKKAAQIADVFGLTPEEVDRPVRIFGD